MAFGGVSTSLLPVFAESTDGSTTTDATVTAPDAVYTGKPYDQAKTTVTGLTGYTTSFQYYQDVDGNWQPIASAPTNVGKYQVTAQASTADETVLAGFEVPAEINLPTTTGTTSGSVAVPAVAADRLVVKYNFLPNPGTSYPVVPGAGLGTGTSYSSTIYDNGTAANSVVSLNPQTGAVALTPNVAANIAKLGNGTLTTTANTAATPTPTTG